MESSKPPTGLPKALLPKAPTKRLWSLMVSLSLIVAFTLAAGLGATVSGVIGMAGGTLLLGLMVVLGLEPAVAVPIHAAVQLISNSTRVFAHLGHVRWRPLWIYCLCALPGPIAGLWLVRHIEPEVVRAIMGGLILLAVWGPKRSMASLSDRTAFGLAGALAGTLGVLVGAVGPLIAPFFLRGSFKKREIIATKAMCQGSIHFIKIIAFGGLYAPLLLHTQTPFAFDKYLSLIVPMATATVAGTYLGKWLLTRINDQRFILIYRITLSLLAFNLILHDV